MFRAKKPTREKLFEKAMLSRKDRVIRRRATSLEEGGFPWVSLPLWSAFSLVGGYILFFSPALMIQEVQVEGENILPAAEYRSVAESLMEGSSFGVLNRRNFFFVPTGQITTSILDQYPQMASVSVSRHFPASLRVKLTESDSILLWCSGGPCYGVRDGRAVLMPLAEDSRYDSIRFSVIDQSALPVALGEELHPVEPYLGALLSVKKNFLKLGVGGVASVARTPSRHSGEITLSTDEGWELMLSVLRPVEDSLGMLRAFLSEYSKEHSDRSALTSIDLRVEGKVFYAEKSVPVVPIPIENGTKPEEKNKKKKSNQ